MQVFPAFECFHCKRRPPIRSNHIYGRGNFIFFSPERVHSIRLEEDERNMGAAHLALKIFSQEIWKLKCTKCYCAVLYIYDFLLIILPAKLYGSAVKHTDLEPRREILASFYL